MFSQACDYSEVRWARFLRLAITLCDRVSSSLDEVCQFDIIFRQAAAVMCTECNLYFVVHVKPFGVMIHFLGLQSNTCHESKRLVEIFEKEFLVNSVSAFHFCPPRFAQGRKSCVSFFFVEFLAFWCWHDGKKTKKCERCSLAVHSSAEMKQVAREGRVEYLPSFHRWSIFYSRCTWRYTNRKTVKINKTSLYIVHIRTRDVK